MDTYLSLVILVLVFFLIAVRQIGQFNFRIWQVMLGGAVAVLVTGQITVSDAFRAINVDVMLFLFGMFVVGESLEESGFLYTLAHRLFSRAQTTDHLILLLIFSFGIFSTFLMNDTLAIIGTPLALFYARKLRISVQVLLLALCCAVTTGSVMSPIGNPQNLLVATYSGMENPFLSFALYLGIPTLISLGVTFLLIRAMYPKDFGKTALIQEEERITDTGLDALVRISLAILLILVIARTMVSVVPAFGVISLPAIAILSALPILLFSRKRFTVLRSIDWHTLIFFVAMFVLMGSVWQSGIFQSFLREGVPDSVPGIITVSVILSQFVSNVPFVALFQPLLVYQGIPLAH
ncbi:MAG: anion transporter, partial [Methanomicrobiales archaeon]|nr:anion transporter [Methanomicrobiales archaeon]